MHRHYSYNYHGVRPLQKLLDAEALARSSQGSSDADMGIVLNKSKSLRNFQGDVGKEASVLSRSSYTFPSSSKTGVKRR